MEVFRRQNLSVSESRQQSDIVGCQIMQPHQVSLPATVISHNEYSDVESARHQQVRDCLRPHRQNLGYEEI